MPSVILVVIFCVPYIILIFHFGFVTVPSMSIVRFFSYSVCLSGTLLSRLTVRDPLDGSPVHYYNYIFRFWSVTVPSVPRKINLVFCVFSITIILILHFGSVTVPSISIAIFS